MKLSGFNNILLGIVKVCKAIFNRIRIKFEAAYVPYVNDNLEQKQISLFRPRRPTLSP